MDNNGRGGGGGDRVDPPVPPKVTVEHGIGSPAPHAKPPGSGSTRGDSRPGLAIYRVRCEKHIDYDDRPVVEYDADEMEGGAGCWLCIMEQQVHDYEMALHRVHAIADRLLDGAHGYLAGRRLRGIVDGIEWTFDEPDAATERAFDADRGDISRRIP